ncbi:GNAT family N-acetyltransferase [Neobacillus sp. NPDC093182]|uniref:GNAT family N-acetyltransferase n=1 Tax=Neobacillus sp. NPDC093182 TaxID=3364297 RepID=UPI003830A1B6
MNNIVTAKVEDSAEILSLQKLAYVSQAELAGDYSIQPLTQTLAELEKEFENNLILIYMHDGNIIGSVRGYERDGTCHISKLMVHPEFQNRGIGKELMRKIESMFIDVRFELFTGSQSTKNISFYEKLGYRGYKKGKLDREETVFIFMEKSALHHKSKI